MNPPSNIFLNGWIVFAAMIAVFLAMAFWRKKPIGIALLFGAITGGLVGGNGIPVRHLVEGSFTYFEPILIIFTAMLFMRVFQDNGALGSLAKWIVENFGQKPALFLIIVTFFIMFPAMLTGITTTSVLTTGALIAPALIAMGIPAISAAAMIALIGMMGMMAPPINLIVMLIGQGVDMPYIGFEGPLAAIAFPLALIAAFSLGFKHLSAGNVPSALTAFKASEKVSLKMLLPLIIVFGLMFLVRLLPKFIPDIGAPLIFVIGAIVALFTGKPVKISTTTYQALLTGLPVLGLLVGIGMFLQIMTLTGVRGLLVVTVLSLPIALTYLGLLISLPVFGGVSAFASAMVFGIPFLLSLLGRNEIVACAGIALLACLGDIIPPSAIEARFGAQVTSVDNFLKVTQKALPLILFFALIGLAVIYWADKLAFLVL